MNNRPLVILSTLAFLFCSKWDCAYAQTVEARRRAEVSTPLFTGDMQIHAGNTALALHYAIVPLKVKGEVSFYTRFSQAIMVKNTITDAAGKLVKFWASESASEQCFVNISQDVIEQGHTTGYTWVITDAKGTELARIPFTAQDALGK